MAQSTSEIERLVNDYLDVWNDGDYAKMSDVLAESIAVYDPGAPEGEVHGHGGLEALLRELRTAFPDFRVAIDDMLAGDETIMAEWTFTGTHEGEFNGVPPTGRKVELTGMDTMRISDGKVHEHRIYYDRQELFEQLGLTDE